MDAAEVDRKVMRAIAFRGRACKIDDIQPYWGLEKEDVEASLARLAADGKLTRRVRARAAEWDVRNG